MHALTVSIDLVKDLQPGSLVEAARDLTTLCGVPKGMAGVVTRPYNADYDKKPPVVQWANRHVCHIYDHDVVVHLKNPLEEQRRFAALTPMEEQLG